MAEGTHSDRLKRWIRQVKRMFHMLVGLVFFGLALAGAWLSFVAWKDYLAAPSQGLWRFGLEAGFSAFLLVLCLYSFLKARSVR
jgi:hypothetical protein